MLQSKSKEYIIQQAEKYVFAKPGTDASLVTLKSYESDSTKACMLAGMSIIPIWLLVSFNNINSRILLHNYYAGICNKVYAVVDAQTWP